MTQPDQPGTALFTCKLDGDRFVLRAASTDEADSLMARFANERCPGAAPTPCEPLEGSQVGGLTIWQVPD